MSFSTASCFTMKFSLARLTNSLILSAEAPEAVHFSTASLNLILAVKQFNSASFIARRKMGSLAAELFSSWASKTRVTVNTSFAYFTSSRQMGLDESPPPCAFNRRFIKW